MPAGKNVTSGPALIHEDRYIVADLPHVGDGAIAARLISWVPSSEAFGQTSMRVTINRRTRPHDLPPVPNQSIEPVGRGMHVTVTVLSTIRVQKPCGRRSLVNPSGFQTERGGR